MHQNNMLVIHIEASHQKGMGHLFRCLSFIKGLNEHAPLTKYLVVVNSDRKAVSILESEKINYTVVDNKAEKNWEKEIIRKYGVTSWLNDRLDTDIAEVKRVKDLGIPVFTIDDKGTGAELSEINFASLVFGNNYLLKGKKLLTGEKYLILNPEIAQYRKQKKKIKKVIVTMGGSDTYNLTLLVLNALFETNLPISVTVIVGPGSDCYNEAKAMIAEWIKKKSTNSDNDLLKDGMTIMLKSNVPSLMLELSENDLAFTAGGVTPFEAAALGVPTISIAAELHEIGICQRLKELECSSFLGFRKDINSEQIGAELIRLYNDLEAVPHMSKNGLLKVDTDGAKRMLGEMGIYE